MRYFAYGSNMSISRLRERVPSARKIDVFVLKGHQLRFNKRSKDGSAKCNITESDSSDLVYGVLYEIAAEEKIRLDKAEGLGAGYAEKVVSVESRQGQLLTAVTYYATDVSENLQPYDWYLNHVIVGAIESGIPEKYIKSVKTVVAIQDLNVERDSKQRALYQKSESDIHS